MLYLLHHCRGLAAILVVLFHIHSSFNTYGIDTPLTQLFRYGGSIGVAFFFALSGFIILYVHKQDIQRPEKLKS